MADYIVKDTELTSIANAIRTAGSTNNSLTFPNGFVSAVENIGGGGGSSDFSTAEVTVSTAEGISDMIYAPMALEQGGMNAATPMLNGEGKNNVILYKGTAIGMLSNPSLSVNVTGSIQYNSGQFVITGNGTITITV